MFDEIIGNFGTGSFAQTGGTNSVTNDLDIGNESGSGGTFDISGCTTTVGSDINLSFFAGSSGTLNLSGTGSLSNHDLRVGRAGTGTFTQTGGTNSVTTELLIGAVAGSSGTFNLSGGSFSASNAFVGGRDSASGGSGTMNISVDADVLISAAMKLWEAGVVNLSGGTLDVTSIDNTNGGSFNMTGGTLKVDTFTGDLALTGGTLAPGNSPGLTTVLGDFSMDINSTLQMEIGGLIPETEYDVLNVSGMMSLGGTLEVVLYDNFVPQLGDTFDILNWGSLTGMFDFLVLPTLVGNIGWDTSNLYTTGELGVQSVPEPATVALLGLGLAGLGGMYLRRRRKQNAVSKNVRFNLQD